MCAGDSGVVFPCQNIPANPEIPLVLPTPEVLAHLLALWQHGSKARLSLLPAVPNPRCVSVSLSS